MRFLGIVCCFMMSVMLSSQYKVDKGLKVLVLDALDGTPQAGVQVHYFCAGKLHNSPAMSAFTNHEGVADVPYSCGEEERIELWTTAPNKKEQCGELPPLTFSEIASVGIVSKPDADGGIWCPVKASRYLKHVPGKVIIFIKKPTWWQSHVAG